MDVFAELSWRGLVHDHTPAVDELLAREPVVLYHGIDATADSLHVGNLVGVLTLRRLQRAGHRPLALLGGGTTLIGDPSGKETERPLLTPEQIDVNAEGIRRQLETLLDFGSGAGSAQARLLNNADWLRGLGLTDFLRDVGKHFTVNVMIAKESVRARLHEREQGISFTEFSYMLLQAYDYLHLFDADGCRLQVGGSDQWGNITAGIDLVRRARGAEVHGLTWPLITKADGTKFGKSEGGNVWLDPARTSPYQFFQFWIQADDADVIGYLRLLSDLDAARIAELEGALAERPEAREAQRVLAEHLTTLVHGPEEAAAAARAAEVLFGGDPAGLDERTLGHLFAEVPSTVVARAELDGGLGLVELLARTGVDPSLSAARRSVGQGGVYVNNRREADLERRIGNGDLLCGRYLLLRKGKRTYHAVRFE